MSRSIPTRSTPTAAAGGCGGLRHPQLVWAQSHTDVVARELGIDPIEFRRRNLLREAARRRPAR
jgi:CO/xanthine dehydrogenase Mo-binding subunit